MGGVNISREKRKLDHINFTVALEVSGDTGLEDVFLLHNALPELDLDEIDTSTIFCGKEILAPIIINAITGGAKEVTKINRSLARAARMTGIAMAVGSQHASLEDNNLTETFKVAREENPGGVILANLSCGAGIDDAKKAVEMIDADGLQLHLNIPQELQMTEGDRQFKGYLKNIEEIIKAVKVPVIVKEVGFGISREVARQLIGVGVKNIDIGGSGGTNFITVEKRRKGHKEITDIETWGIPTVCSLVEVNEEDIPGYLIASGGISTPLEAAKALALGADLVGIAGAFLKILKEENEENLINKIEEIKIGLKEILLMTGSKNLAGLKKVPVIITGSSRVWLHERGIDTKKYANR